MGQPKRTKDEEDDLDVFGTLIEPYEETHCPMGKVSGVDMLVPLMEARGVTQTLVSQGAAIPLSTVSEILAGKRKLNVRHIAALSAILQGGPWTLHRPEMTEGDGVSPMGMGETGAVGVRLFIDLDWRCGPNFA